MGPQPPPVCQGWTVNQPPLPHVVIVGGGIAGLAAAFFLRDEPVTVTVLEGAPRIGGKLSVSEVAGIAVDEGAEALLTRRPEGTGLIRAVGLAGEMSEPATVTAGIWSRGRLCPLPRRQFMGVPADFGDLARTGLLSPDGLARAERDADLPATARVDDVSVAGYVGARFGMELVDRLVDPLLGGVYAGRSEDLSFEATLPGLAEESRRHASLSEAAAALLPPAAPAAGQDAGKQHAGKQGAGRQGAGGETGRVDNGGQPGSGPGPVPAPQPGRGGAPRAGRGSVFTTLTGGLGSLPPAVAAASRAHVRTGVMVRELARTPGGWRLTAGSAHAPEYIDADAVVLAVPARPAGRLLTGLAGTGPARAALAGIPYASMAIATLAYPAEAFPRVPEGSGYLVPAVEGHAVKAVTFATVKWPHLRTAAPGLIVVRCSLGRIGEEALLQRDDRELAATAASDLAEATGVRGTPAAARVTRWGGGLPQYLVGHRGRVARIRAGVASQPGLAVCGAAYDGLGIPACIATAAAAARDISAYLRGRPAGAGPAAGARTPGK